MSFFTAKTLRGKLQLENKVYTKNIFASPIHLKLDKKKRYIPFISSECSNKSEKAELNFHFFLLE
jgi:hypothetical protein